MSNAGIFAEALIAKGHKLASGGTDNHLVLWDLRPHGLTGSKVEKVCEPASISLNRNTVPGDASALSPGVPSFVARFAPLRRTTDAFPFWPLCSDSPLSSRPQPLGSGGDVAPCEDTREDFGLSL